jgi:hypothetical protein
MLACIAIIAISIWLRIFTKLRTAFAKSEEVSSIFCHLLDVVFSSTLAFFMAALLGDTSFTGVLSTPLPRHCKNIIYWLVNHNK